MKKRVLLLLLTLALLITCAALTVSATDSDSTKTVNLSNFKCPCSKCNGSPYSGWETISGGTSLSTVDGGHYYITGQVSLSSQLAISTSKEVVILIDNTSITVGGTGRALLVHTSGAVLHLIGNNATYTTTSSTGNDGAVAQVSSGGKLHLYGDLTIEKSANATGVSANSGLIKTSGGTVHIHDCDGMGLPTDKDPVLNAPQLKDNTASLGGITNLTTSSCAFIVDAGTLNGTTKAYAGGVFSVTKGTLTINGGTINGGSVTNGGAIYQAAGTVNINAGTISGGVAADKGGAIYVEAGTLNIGADTKNYPDGPTISGSKAKNGGGVYIYKTGTANMGAGSISGCEATSVGGAVYVFGDKTTRGLFDMSGGTITADGTKSGSSKGVRVQWGSLKLSGKATVISGGGETGCGVDLLFGLMNLDGEAQVYTPEGKTACNILVRANAGAKLTVEGTWQGSATVLYKHIDEDGSYAPGGEISTSWGVSTGDYSGALYLQNEDSLPRIYGKDGKLVFSDVQLCTDSANTWLKNNATAVEDYAASSNAKKYIKLYNNKPLDLAGKEVYVDFNGNSNQVTVGDGGVLYGFDSSADNTNAGNTRATVTGQTATFVQNPVTGENYIMIEEDGTSTFHVIKPVISSVSLRPGAAGVYYSAKILCDATLAEKVSAAYGIAVGVDNMPDAQFMSNSLYTKVEGKLTPGGSFNGVLVSNILKDGGDNEDRALKNICANAYVTVTLADGQTRTYMSSDTGNAAQRNLQEVMRKVNGIYRTLTDGQKAGVDSLYKQYNDLMKQDSWRLHNIAAANGDDNYATDGIKVLMIGNSLSVDAGRMLGYVFATQGVDNVRISTLYHSGCTLQMHVNYLTGNKYEYNFYNCEYESAAEALKDPKNLVPTNVTNTSYTMEMGIQEDEWDIVVLQQGTTTAAQAETYNENIQIIMDYVNARQETPPIYIWNSVWASPHDMISYASNDIAPDTSGSVYYSLMGYANEKAAAMEPEAQIRLTQMIADAMATKILPDQRFDYAIPSGIAQINAWSSYMDNWDLYRDYVHASDLGRLMNAYVWYSAITGQEVTEIVDSIPAALFNTSNEYYLKPTTDRPIRDIEKAVMLESIANAFKNPYSMTQSQYTECPQQTGEEADTLRILMLGDSNTANVAAKLKKVYNEQLAGQKVTVASLSCENASAYQHALNVKKSNAVYTYTENGEVKKVNAAFLDGIKAQAWDMIIVQPGAADLSSEAGFKRYNQNNRRDLERLIRENVVDPGCQFVWHTAWSDPTGDTFDPAALLTAQVNAYTSYVSYETMYAYRLSSGTAMVHAYLALGDEALETLWTDSALAEAGQYVAAYALYAQLGGVQLESAALAGDLAETVIAAANYAQATPWTVPTVSES